MNHNENVLSLARTIKETSDVSIAPMLADALEESISGDYSALRQGQDVYGIVNSILQQHYMAAHIRNVEDQIKELEEKSAAAYSDRCVSVGYWAMQKACLLLNNPGYKEVLFHDLRGTPPAGTIWIRRSSSGRYGKSRKDKRGRPLTLEEMAS